MSEINPISTFIINKRNRSDRRVHILNQFLNKEEFVVQIVTAIECEIGAVGLWNTIKYIITELITGEENFILLCEDDHEFTDAYSAESLVKAINNAKNSKADILLGGVSGFFGAVELSNNLFWVETFSGLQFTIIFRKFFDTILNTDFNDYDNADFKFADISNYKFLMVPFISIQRDFGYSDVTEGNNVAGRMQLAFKESQENLLNIQSVNRFYSLTKEKLNASQQYNLNEITLTTFVLYTNTIGNELENITKQFRGKKEFDVKFVNMSERSNDLRGHWEYFREIIIKAIADKEDVIVICRDKHEFTENYSKEFFLSNLLQAHIHGTEILMGGISFFKQLVPISESRYWIDSVHGSQFIVLFRNVFSKILNEPTEDYKHIDEYLSIITSNKVVIHPFISKWRTTSEYSKINTQAKKVIPDTYNETNDRISKIKRIINELKN
ncbi:hypothetical protein [Chitinophaga sp. OAE865]|uniref:hypothetical protein n=1 Tax=Chitinophaga sp. OAE865 TaxID=2817898 RepID=UPI001AE5F572